MDLDIAVLLRRKRCKTCRAKRACESCWRAFSDSANILARQRDKNRAKA